MEWTYIVGAIIQYSTDDGISDLIELILDGLSGGRNNACICTRSGTTAV